MKIRILFLICLLGITSFGCDGRSTIRPRKQVVHSGDTSPIPYQPKREPVGMVPKDIPAIESSRGAIDKPSDQMGPPRKWSPKPKPRIEAGGVAAAERYENWSRSKRSTDEVEEPSIQRPRVESGRGNPEERGAPANSGTGSRSGARLEDDTPANSNDPSSKVALKGQSVPSIVGEDTEGVYFRLSDYRNKVILLEFWGDWCENCRETFPARRSLVDKMQGRPFKMLGVNTDTNVSRAHQSIQTNNINWRSWYDGRRGPIAQDFDVKSFPRVLLIDHTGVVRFDSIRGRSAIDREVEKLVTAAERDGNRGTNSGEQYRTFKDKTGKYSVRAVFDSVQDGMIVLRKDDGSNVKMSPDHLSLQDRQYLENSGVLADLEASRSSISRRNFARNSFRLYEGVDGEFEFEAKFVHYRDRKVTLEKRDGSRVSIDLYKFSDDDRNFLRKIIIRQDSSGR